MDINSVLEKISLVFGTGHLNVVIPDDLMINVTLLQIVNIDEANLDKEPNKQSKYYMLFSCLSAYVANQVELKNAEVDRLKAKLYINTEEELVRNGERATEKKIENLLVNHPDYITMMESYFYYKNMKVTFDNIVRSLDRRNDMLIQLMAKRKRETESQVT